MVSFERDIRPLFRDKDVKSMRSAFDLHAYADVKTHSQAIYDAVVGGEMPCDGPWPAEHTTLFKQWMDAGMPA